MSEPTPRRPSFPGYGAPEVGASRGRRAHSHRTRASSPRRVRAWREADDPRSATRFDF